MKAKIQFKNKVSENKKKLIQNSCKFGFVCSVIHCIFSYLFLNFQSITIETLFQFVDLNFPKHFFMYAFTFIVASLLFSGEDLDD